MAIPKIPLSDAELRANFAMKCREWARKAEEQKTNAKEMFESASKMRERAREMINPPHRFVLP